MLNHHPCILQVRSARPSDAQRLALLFAQLGYAEAGIGLEQRLEQQLKDPLTGVLVATASQAVAGVLVLHVFAPLHVPRPWAVISSLVVDEQIRSQGAGAALMAAAEQVALARNCAHIELSSSERRTGAHAFYAAHGFIEKRKRLIKYLAVA